MIKASSGGWCCPHSLKTPPQQERPAEINVEFGCTATPLSTLPTGFDFVKYALGRRPDRIGTWYRAVTPYLTDNLQLRDASAAIYTKES